jgi:hypothetical protein
MAKSARFNWDVFVSHNRHQKPWVRALVDQWRSLALKVFFDEDTIEPGEDVVGAIERGIERSRHVVFIITPTSVASPWVAMETAMTIFNDPDARARRLIPVLLEPTPRDRIRPGVRRLNWIDLTDPGTRLDRYHYLLKFLMVTERPPFPVIPVVNGEQNPEATHVSMYACNPIINAVGGDRCSAAMTPDAASKSQIELVLDRDFESYTQQDQDRLLAAIKELLSLKGDIRVISRRPGSVCIRLELTPEQAEQLYWAVRRGALAEHDVVDVNYPAVADRRPVFRLGAAGARTTAALAAFVMLATAYAIAAIIGVHFLPRVDDPLSSPISQYAVGRFGFVMTAALYLWGIAGWALAVGLSRGVSPPVRSRAGLVLLVVFGAGLVVASCFPMDVPFRPRDPTPTGAIHLFAASVSTLLFPFAALLWARSFRSDEPWLPFYPFAHRLGLVLLVAMPIVFAIGQFYFALFGLVQKIYGLLVLAWIMASAIRLRRVAGGRLESGWKIS